jgi:uncharacterized protein YqeY
MRKPVTELSDDEVQSVVKRLVKQRKDSIEQYQVAGRTALVEKESAELALIVRYLPTPLSNKAVEEIVERVLNTLPGATIKDMGRVMGAVMKETAGRAEGELVRQLVSTKLQ